jgi:Holliday junction resolvasome RuvABC ATP-dependent DNA helicase subunit
MVTQEQGFGPLPFLVNYIQSNNAILFIDEAHCLSSKHLELHPVLLNFETDKEVLQIVSCRQ